jgi:quinol monooxygenase YgiN
MGAEHLISDRQRVKAYLDEELQTTSLDDLMPWYYEPCGIDNLYVRVSIRAIKENLVSEDMLLDAFIRSANIDKRPTVESWRDRWHKIIGTIDRMNLNLPNYQQDREFIDSVLSVGRYAISHSQEYREAYRPHYRIVEKSIFENEIKPMIESKTMVVRIAEIEVHPQYLKDYLETARNVGAESVKKEPGVICIFPNQMTEDENKIRIVEIYKNKEAYEHHLTTEHFQAYKQGTLHMVKSLNLVDLSPLDKEAMPLIFTKIQL